jgi:chromosome segregation ATPase
MAEAPGSPIKFPSRPASASPALSLRRKASSTRSPFDVSAASAEARKQIDNIVSATRAPFAGAPAISSEQAGALQKSLREIEMRLAERERLVEEAEARLSDRERDLAEAEALIAARQKIIDAQKIAAPKAGVSKEEQAALEQLKAELDRQEATIREHKATLAEREQFLEENETKLFEKMMLQQEKETELEQRGEDLSAREKRLVDKEGGGSGGEAPNPEPAEKKPFDEFNE